MSQESSQDNSQPWESGAIAKTELLWLRLRHERRQVYPFINGANTRGVIRDVVKERIIRFYRNGAPRGGMRSIGPLIRTCSRALNMTSEYYHVPR